MNGCVRVYRNHRIVSCWTKSLDDYTWTLAQVCAMPSKVNIHAGWVSTNGTQFTECRYSRVDGEEREWEQTQSGRPKAWV
jgi:hypothetical protein